MNAEETIRDAVAKYHDCLEITFDPDVPESKRDLHGAYAGHHSVVAVLFDALRRANPNYADEVATWWDEQAGETLDDWMAEWPEVSGDSTYGELPCSNPCSCSSVVNTPNP